MNPTIVDADPMILARYAAGMITLAEATEATGLDAHSLTIAVDYHAVRPRLPGLPRRRRPWAPNGPNCGTISHYHTGCGSDACRLAARLHRRRYRTTRTDELADELTIHDRCTLAMASMGIPT